MNDKIDIVYLWVDSNDEKWRTQRDEWYKKTKSGNAKNYLYRENDELMYSLRSVDECAPWVNHIYIVTGFNQKPKWLNTKNKKITIVSHKQILPKKALPVFNSTAIEMGIANIPNLSEKFILMNDDTFFNKTVKPDFFFDKHGRAIVLYNKHPEFHNIINNQMKNVDEYTASIILANIKINQIFNKKLLTWRPSHGIDPYLKSSWLECQNHPLIKSDLNKQIYNKFRTKSEIHRWLFNLYDYFMGRAVFKKARCYKSTKNKFSDFIYNTIHWHKVNLSPVFCLDANKKLKSIKHAPVFCINDSDETTPDTIKHNIEFLKKRFPNKSQFEI